MEVNAQKLPENQLKMKELKFKSYPYELLNTCKGVIRSRELSLTTQEEIKVALDKQDVTEYKRIQETEKPS